MAARAWANDNLKENSVQPEQEVLADAEAFGIPAELVTAQLDAARHDSDLADFNGVWPENELAVRAFLAVANQWRMAGREFLSLDYAACRAGWKALRIKLSAVDFARFQTIEGEAALLMNKRVATQ